MTNRKRPSDDAVDVMHPPPGLDNTKHANAQRRAAKAEIIRNRLIAAHLAATVGNGAFDPADFEVYLDGILNDLGRPTGPIHRMLVEQLAFIHLRLVGLHRGAAAAKGTETVKIYNGACARLLGEFRRTALTLDALLGKAPAAARLKVAQTG